MPYGDLAAERVQRFATAGRSRRGAVHGRGARGIRAPYRSRQSRLRRRRLRRDPRARPKRKQTSSCGMAATTISRSSGPICTSPSPTRCGRARSRPIIPARRSRAWPTSSSSTRWMRRAPRRLAARSRRFAGGQSARDDRLRRVAGAARRSRPWSRAARSGDRGWPDHHPWRHALWRGLCRGQCGRRAEIVDPATGSRGRDRRGLSPPIPISARSCRHWVTARQSSRRSATTIAATPAEIVVSRHADRPRAADPHRQAGGAGALRIRRSRRAPLVAAIDRFLEQH